MADAPDFSGLSAIFFNGTLTKGDKPSHTDGLIRRSEELMKQNGVKTEVIRTINTDMATGIYPDMTEYGYDSDEWPAIFERVKAADIVVIGGPIWLGDNSSMTKKLIERIYANSSDVNEQGQNIYYGKVGGCLITGNEDGVKHCSSNVLYSLQHVGFTIPPQADAGWLGEIGPGPSYLDEGSGGPENDFTNKNLTFMTYNLMHMARLLKGAGGVPAYGNQPSKWKGGEHFGFDEVATHAANTM
ncbi:MAG TPA: flavodoxin family protein [Candidatus Saccharimonadales bacterium]|jgi:multimeric flavodoxin WrbA